MSDATQAAGQAPAATDTSAPVTTTVPALSAVQQAAPEAEPAWLKGRLERAERAAEERAIKALGFTSADDAKKALAAAQAAADAQKTEEQRLREQVSQLDPLRQQLESHKSALAEFAKTELGALPEKARAVVIDLAGDDPAAQLRAITKMRANGLLAPEPQKPAPLPAPANTAAPAAAPSAATPGNPNHAAEYERLQQANPYRAAAYFARHKDAILAARKAGRPTA